MAPASVPVPVTSSWAVPVDLLSSSVTVKVVSGDTVYYADQPYVTSTSNQGSIANGASQTFTTGVWLKSAGLSAVTTTQGAAAPQGIVLGSDGAIGGPGGTALTASVIATSLITPIYYGAAGNGTTDDTAALQLALNDQIANNGPPILIDRVYATKDLTFPNYAMLLGSGLGGPGAGRAGLKALSGTGTVLKGPVGGAYENTLRDLYIDATLATAGGVNLDHPALGESTKHRVRDVHVVAGGSNNITAFSGGIVEGVGIATALAWDDRGGNLSLIDFHAFNGMTQLSAQVAGLWGCTLVGGLKAFSAPIQCLTVGPDCYIYGDPTNHRCIDATAQPIYELTCIGAYFVPSLSAVAGYVIAGSYAHLLKFTNCQTTPYQSNLGNFFDTFTASDAGAIPLISVEGGRMFTQTGGGHCGTFWNVPSAAKVAYQNAVVDVSGTDYVRVARRVVTVAQSATPAININVTDVASITGLAQAITSMTTNLTGTPVDGDLLTVRLTDNGTGRGITWGANFEASTVALPTTTVASALLTTNFAWNAATSKWRVVSVA